MSCPAIVIAGVQSGVGKTTIATGLMAALTARGLRVQPFKAGPDYIDPSYHTAVCGRASRNLDGWLVGEAATVDLFHRATADADVAVVEGVMGLFDGRAGGGEQGSTAQLAKLLGLPVLLVLDAGALARSAGAIALGFRQFDPALKLAGVIVNNVASASHGESLRDAIEREAGVPVMGLLPREPGVVLPERHLGLIPVTEGATASEFFGNARDLVGHGLNLDRLLATCAPANAPPPEPGLFPTAPLPARARIAVAMDRAFSFYYADSLDLLRAWGAELAPFSPLTDPALPAGAGAVYLGGGFPELYAEKLSENTAMLASLRRAAAAGVTVYGECGGLMYLGESLTDLDGSAHTMAELLPLRSSMSRARLSLGYWDIVTRRSTPLAPAGQRLRGHEFHWSVPERVPAPDEALYELAGTERLEGYQRGSVSGSYIHLHLGSDRALAPAFVDAAAVGPRTEG